MDVEQIALFPQNVWKFTTDLKCGELEERCIEAYHKNMANCQFHSNVGGWQSHVDMYKNGNGFEDIRDTIIDRMCIVCQSYGMRGHWALNSLWINLNYPNASNSLHDHIKENERAVNVLSGVLWVRIPKLSGDLQFVNQGETHTVTPFEGGGYIFKSSMQHLVTPNQSNETRISMSFNFELLDGNTDDQVVLYNI